MGRKRLFIAFFVLVLSSFADAQFNSGSTGADGALDTSTMNCASICEVQLPESGILNYTTINIEANKTLKFRFNFRNTPVILRATGDVNIAGSIDVAAGPSTSPDVRVPGPGGFYGGPAGGIGFGPGGGQNGCHGKWIGPLSLAPIIGGSGGNDGPGGGGGGALVIASSTTIHLLSGSGINANGAGWSVNTCWGSGGAVRLVANSLNLAGNVSAVSPYPGGASNGIIRFEAQPGQINYSGTTNPAAIFGPVNPVIIPVDPPTLLIASIAGYAVPAYSAGRPDRIDLVLPVQLPDPLAVDVQGTNVPSGTEVQLRTTAGTATGCVLTGGGSSVNCSGSISGQGRSGISTIMALAVYTPPGALAKFNPKGKNHVAKVRLEAAIASKTKYLFLRSNGTVVDNKLLKPQFLKEFGM